MKSTSWTKWIIAVGMSSAAAGLLLAFQSERHSFVTTTDFDFLFLEKTYIQFLLFGLVVTFVGSILWASRANTSTRLAAIGAELEC